MATLKLISEMTTAELLTEYNSVTGKNTKKFSSRAAGEKAILKLREQTINQTKETEMSLTEQEKEQLADLEDILGGIDDSTDAPETGGVIDESEMSLTEQEKEQLADMEDILGGSDDSTDAPETGGVIDESKVIKNDKSSLIDEEKAEKKAAAEAKKAEKKAAAEAKKAAKKPKMTDEERSHKMAEVWAAPGVYEARTTRAAIEASWTDESGEHVEEFPSAAKAFAALDLPMSVCAAFRTKMRKEGQKTITGKNEVVYTLKAIEKGNPAEAKKAEKAAAAEAKKAEKAKKDAEKAAAKEAKKAAKAKPEAEEVSEELGEVEEV